MYRFPGDALLSFCPVSVPKTDQHRVVIDARIEQHTSPMLSRLVVYCSCRRSLCLRSSARRAFLAASSSLSDDIFREIMTLEYVVDDWHSPLSMCRRVERGSDREITWFAE